MKLSIIVVFIVPDREALILGHLETVSPDQAKKRSRQGSMKTADRTFTFVGTVASVLTT